MGKAIIITAPSGAGKTTLVKKILAYYPSIQFSVSASTRTPRPNEVDGKDYYFLKKETFDEKIKQNEFLEWEEVYAGTKYGTLQSEVERIWEAGKHVIFDIDVQGALRLQKILGSKSLSIFIAPPSFLVLKERLIARNTETAQSLHIRIEKAKSELTFADRFDQIVVNKNVDEAFQNIRNIIDDFISS